MPTDPTVYSYILAAWDSDTLHAQVKALALAGFLGVNSAPAGPAVLFAAALSASDKTTLDNCVAAHVPPSAEAVLQAAAAASFQSNRDDARRDKALGLIFLDAINAIHDRLTAQDNAVKNATSLANLQSQWAALATAAPMPDLTVAQLKAAVLAKIQSSASD